MPYEQVMAFHPVSSSSVAQAVYNLAVQNSLLAMPELDQTGATFLFFKITLSVLDWGGCGARLVPPQF